MTRPTAWLKPPNEIRLETEAIHVWHIILDEPGVAQARALLSPDELERADRFIREIHRQRFAMARGCLRVLLGEYTSTDPTEIAFTYNEQGKPDLEDNPSNLQFNVSHSGDAALMGFVYETPIGMDIEHQDPRDRSDGIARRFFSEREVEELGTYPSDEHDGAFYRCWTRKEAYIKAHGKGLAIPLSSFAMSLGEEAELRWVDDTRGSKDDWRVEHIDVGESYAGALVVRQNHAPITHYDCEASTLLTRAKR